MGGRHLNSCSSKHQSFRRRRDDTSVFGHQYPSPFRYMVNFRKFNKLPTLQFMQHINLERTSTRPVMKFLSPIRKVPSQTGRCDPSASKSTPRTTAIDWSRIYQELRFIYKHYRFFKPLSKQVRQVQKSQKASCLSIAPTLCMDEPCSKLGSSSRTV